MQPTTDLVPVQALLAQADLHTAELAAQVTAEEEAMLAAKEKIAEAQKKTQLEIAEKQVRASECVCV